MKVLTQPILPCPREQLPKSLVPHFVEMVGVGPVTRPNPSDLLAALREHGQFLSNRLVSMALRVEELQVSSKWNIKVSPELALVCRSWRLPREQNFLMN